MKNDRKSAYHTEVNRMRIREDDQESEEAMISKISQSSKPSKQLNMLTHISQTTNDCTKILCRFSLFLERETEESNDPPKNIVCVFGLIQQYYRFSISIFCSHNPI